MKGQRGVFPSNFVEIIKEDGAAGGASSTEEAGERFPPYQVVFLLDD